MPCLDKHQQCLYAPAHACATCLLNRRCAIVLRTSNHATACIMPSSTLHRGPSRRAACRGQYALAFPHLQHSSRADTIQATSPCSKPTVQLLSVITSAVASAGTSAAGLPHVLLFPLQCWFERRWRCAGRSCLGRKQTRGTSKICGIAAYRCQTTVRCRVCRLIRACHA